MNQREETIARLKAMAKRMRLDALDMALSAGRGGAHLGGGLSCIEIMAVLYGEVLNLDPQNGAWPQRDRFLASKSHCVLAHFPALAERGFLLPKEELAELTKDGGRMNGYPRDLQLGLEYSGGSLGMAVSVGIGLALTLREDKNPARVYVLMGDGELHEGSVWEAIMAAPQFKLGNMTVLIDRNHLCYDGNTEDIMALEDLEAKFKAFNWNTKKCDGHDVADILEVLKDPDPDRPTIIIAETVKGKGVSFMENKPEWHQHELTKQQYEQARMEILGGEIA